MADLKKSIENIRLAAAMEGDNMRPALVHAMAAQTADLGEAEILEMIREARAELGIKPPAPRPAVTVTPVPVKKSRLRPGAPRRKILAAG